jgi:L-alanine-DL-glutamate epimerase-like enolase superfamily enzyme
MRITAVSERTVPIGSAARNAAIAFDGMTASTLAIVTDLRSEGEPVVGYAFDSIGRYGKSALMKERFIPRLLAADPRSLLDESGLIDPAAASRVIMQNEKPGGHGERPGVVGLIEAALWDARAKALGEPLWRLLARYCGNTQAQPVIAVYATCGLLRAHGADAARGGAAPADGASAIGDADAASLRDEVARTRGLGYTTVKIKLTGDLESDLARIDAAAAPLPDGGLAVDLNGALSEETAPGWMTRISALPLAWIEEPCNPLDYALLAQVAGNSSAPLATGENLFSFDDARNLLRYGGLRKQCDLVQVDILLSYGVTEYLRILALYEQHGWRRQQFSPHAGHLFSAHAVAGFGLGSAEAAPDAGLVYGGFWDGVEVHDGHVRIPNLPGVGFEGKWNLHALLQRNLG